MEIEVITNKHELCLLQEEWERIESLQNNFITYFSCYRNIYTWVENNLDLLLKVIVVKENKKIIGIAPLNIIKRKCLFYQIKVLTFISNISDYSNFLIDTTSGVNYNRIIKLIFSEIENIHCDKIELLRINSRSLLARYLFSSKYNNHFSYLIENPFIDFRNYSTFDLYSSEFLPKKTKQYINRLKRTIDYDIIVTQDNIIEAISKIHIKEKDYLQSIGNSKRHSLFEDKNTYNYLNSLYENNQNVLSYLLIEKQTNKIICYYTGYVFNNVFHSLNTGYNPDFRRLAVGKIFNYLIFEKNNIEYRWDIFDMGTGRYQWKFEWTSKFNLLYGFKKIKSASFLRKKVIVLEEICIEVLKILRNAKN